MPDFEIKCSKGTSYILPVDFRQIPVFFVAAEVGESQKRGLLGDKQTLAPRRPPLLSGKREGREAAVGFLVPGVRVVADQITLSPRRSSPGFSPSALWMLAAVLRRPWPLLARCQ